MAEIRGVSSTMMVRRGCPHGGILSQLLFLAKSKGDRENMETETKGCVIDRHFGGETHFARKTAHLQCLACVSITRSMHSTPTASLEVISTRVENLLCEAGISTLEHRWLLITAKAAIRSMATNEHPIKKKLDNPTIYDRYANRVRVTKSFHIRAIDAEV
jgi:hypothetical protein